MQPGIVDGGNILVECNRQLSIAGVVRGRRYRYGHIAHGNSNDVGLSRRVLGSNYYRDGGGVHSQAGEDVAGAAGHGVAVDCYCSQAVAGSGGDCHLGDRVVHAGSVRDVRAGKLRAQRARTDRQAAKVGVVGEGGQTH